MSYPDHLSATERKIINRLFRALLEEYPDVEMRVYPGLGEGEPEEGTWSKNPRDLHKDVAATAATVLQVKHPEVRGYFLLIHGNEEDVISDMGAANQEMLDKLDRLDDLVSPD